MVIGIDIIDKYMRSKKTNRQSFYYRNNQVSKYQLTFAMGANVIFKVPFYVLLNQNLSIYYWIKPKEPIMKINQKNPNIVRNTRYINLITFLMYAYHNKYKDRHKQ